jgi:hypothetical protein
MLPALELIETAPVESVAAPVTVNPSNPLQVIPAKVTAFAKVLAVSPLAKVTFPEKVLAVAEELIPLLAPKVVAKDALLALPIVRAAPTPSPKLLTAPVKVTVPVPAVIDRS